MSNRSISGMGIDFEHRISEATAKALCDPYPLPRMGYETDIKVVPCPDWPLCRDYLVVQNISGIYVLVCVSVRKSSWPERFGIELLPNNRAAWKATA